ncbi:NlpC/P60 family protein [uncultured Mucilaginibacter sp.]|uniref:C40 family peptidase n=1 Tax=uncultured Mucilaginibacter sp. TaxID=797541 RepID=UPI0025CF9983|nr:NlpC/P60 family protein [uncultured Mucilaginibacter sp.]
MRFIYVILLLTIAILSCNNPGSLAPEVPGDRHVLAPLAAGTKAKYIHIQTGKTTPAELLAFARGLAGTPYKYGSADPEQGFDCSGFVTCVFNHFGIRVPRPSVDFTFVNQLIDIKKAKPGDLILFTGSDSSAHIVGHIGIIVSNHGSDLKFIHATSQQDLGVTETALTHYYQVRYIETIRVFPQND